MDQWDEVLKELADDSSEYEREGGAVVFSRQGTEHSLQLREVPGEGLSVVRTEAGVQNHIPISTFIQRDLRDLPRLSRQILRALERSAKDRPRFVEGPAEAVVGKTPLRWTAVSRSLMDLLQESEPGTTQLIQLMAQAGQGKTVLLEELATTFARSYQPVPHPKPILLPVDLLGRYVGTIDDAIAGSLNNTYVFPGLSQRDVALCVRKRWLILALDGFDELVARVGTRDAFLRITELLDQLQRSGTVIISARESFFELYQITTAIRSYLQPRTGSYSTITSRLLPWTREQGMQVFTNLGSNSPERDLDDLMAAFESDEQIVLHPFFLTRLADLWQKGERFTGAGRQSDRLTRTKYVIETFIDRESKEKWVTRDGTPLLTITEHTSILGVIAEEMWRSGAFRLTVDELRVAAEIGLSEAMVLAEKVNEVLSKVPTHAALTSRDRGIAFLHDRFFHYFLGCRLAILLAHRDKSSLEQAMISREFSPQVIEWVHWRWQQLGDSAGKVIEFLDGFGSGSGSGEATLASNSALLIAALLHDYKEIVSVTHKTFVGNALTEGIYIDVRFTDCQFWNINLVGSLFQKCIFESCRFGDLRVNSDTRFDDSTLDRCTFTSLEFDGAQTVFSPVEIEKHLHEMGATSRHVPAPSTVAVSRVKAHAIRCVERFLRASERTCDVAIEDIEEDFDDARTVASIGLKTGVFREVSKVTPRGAPS